MRTKDEDCKVRGFKEKSREDHVGRNIGKEILLSNGAEKFLDLVVKEQGFEQIKLELR